MINELIGFTVTVIFKKVKQLLIEELINMTTLLDPYGRAIDYLADFKVDNVQFGFNSSVVPSICYEELNKLG